MLTKPLICPLQIPRSHCWVYDPLFSQLEIAVLSTLGVVVLSENEVRGLREGSRERRAAAHQADPGPCPWAPGSVY